ncbi:MAG: hypothetical protein CME25_00125 [Gemmatimonadetes bacterium]|nr:hypothetical protein [Gemmatimonadota bacterium]
MKKSLQHQIPGCPSNIFWGGGRAAVNENPAKSNASIGSSYRTSSFRFMIVRSILLKKEPQRVKSMKNSGSSVSMCCARNIYFANFTWKGL